MGRPVSTNKRKLAAAAASKGKQQPAARKRGGPPQAAAGGKKRGRHHAKNADVYETDDAPDVFDNNKRYDVRALLWGRLCLACRRRPEQPATEPQRPGNVLRSADHAAICASARAACAEEACSA